MRILFLHTDSFGGFGGIAKFNRDFLTALCSYRTADVVALPRRIENEEATNGLTINGLSFDVAGVGGKIRYALAVFRAALRQGPFDLVICGHIHLFPLGWVCRMFARGKLGLVIHGIEAWRSTKNQLLNRLLRRVDFFISVSDFTRDKFCEWSGLSIKKGYIIPNSIDLTRFVPGPKKPELMKQYNLIGKKVIIFVGRLAASERYKGVDEVLEALPSLSREIPEICFLVVGGGDDLLRLRQKAFDLGVGERVIFTGRIPEEDKVAHFRLADIFVMPGQGEGFGIVYLEALGCGIPCVGSMLDGSREALLGGELGVLVDPTRMDDLLRGIFDGLRWKIILREKLSFFSFSSFQKRVFDLLAEILGQQAERVCR